MGVLIVLNVSFPVIFLSLILYGLGSIHYGVKGVYGEAGVPLKPHLFATINPIAAIEDKVKRHRHSDAVKTIEQTTDKITGTVEKSVEPIRKSLLSLSRASRA